MPGAVIAKIRCYRNRVNPEYIGWEYAFTPEMKVE